MRLSYLLRSETPSRILRDYKLSCEGRRHGGSLVLGARRVCVGWCVRIAIACSRLQILLGTLSVVVIVDLSFFLLFRGTWGVLVGYERAGYFLCWHTIFAKWFLMVVTWQGIATKRQRFECCYHRLSYMKTWMRPLRNKLSTSSISQTHFSSM